MSLQSAGGDANDFFRYIQLSKPRLIPAVATGACGAPGSACANGHDYHRSVTNHTPSVAPDGDPAPGGPVPDSGALLRSLAETVTVDGTDQLATREKAVPWLRAAGLLPEDAVLSGSEHGALLRMRDALRDAMAARASFQPDPDTAARLTKALADGRLVVTVAAGRKVGARQFRPCPLLQRGRRDRDRRGGRLVTRARECLRLVRVLRGGTRTRGAK